MKNTKLAELDLLSNEVDIQFNVLGTLVLHRIRRKVDGRHIVTVDNGGLVDGDVEVSEKLTKPTSLGHSIGYCSVFRFCAGARHGWLPFGGPGHKRVADVNAVTRRGSSIVRAARPICIRVGKDVARGRGLKTKAVLSSSTDIAKDSLNESPVHITRSVHMETYLLNGVADVMPSQCQVLQSAGNAAIERCVRSRCADRKSVV